MAKVFAFQYAKKNGDNNPRAAVGGSGLAAWSYTAELERLKLSPNPKSEMWKVSNVNTQGKLSEYYPSVLVVSGLLHA